MKNINRVHDLTGLRFGKLTVLGMDSQQETRKTYWNCICDCGNIKNVRSDGLLSGSVKSCGCLKKSQDRINLAANHKHKQSGTRLYQIWQGLKGRCYNPHNARYARYGGRGIKVCAEWENDFSAFYSWAMEHGYSDALTIERIDNDGNYDPDNCMWATAKQQARNRKSNIEIKIGNATKTLTEWCEIFQLDYGTVNMRYKRNGFASIDDLFNKG